jgi:hypothetical protein
MLEMMFVVVLLFCSGEFSSTDGKDECVQNFRIET